MTDKQIIIDGVDVSKCKHYDKGFNYCDQSYLGKGGILKNTKNPRHCEWLPNCYYKQLKQAEQTVEACHKYQAELEDKLESKEQECERLTSTLTEIKEIAEVLITTTDEYDSCYYKDRCSKCEVKEDCQYFKVEQILQKISEVEE